MIEIREFYKYCDARENFTALIIMRAVDIC